MATKTFEELKQLAIQIRDEKTNKANTATRIGTQMIEHLNKLEQEYYNKDGVAEQLKTRDDELARLESNIISRVRIEDFFEVKEETKECSITTKLTPFSFISGLGDGGAETVGKKYVISITFLNKITDGTIYIMNKPSNIILNSSYFEVNKEYYFEVGLYKAENSNGGAIELRIQGTTNETVSIRVKAITYNSLLEKERSIITGYTEEKKYIDKNGTIVSASYSTNSKYLLVNVNEGDEVSIKNANYSAVYNGAQLMNDDLSSIQAIEQDGTYVVQSGYTKLAVNSNINNNLIVSVNGITYGIISLINENKEAINENKTDINNNKVEIANNKLKIKSLLDLPINSIFQTNFINTITSCLIDRVTDGKPIIEKAKDFTISWNLYIVNISKGNTISISNTHNRPYPTVCIVDNLTDLNVIQSFNTTSVEYTSTDFCFALISNNSKEYSGPIISVKNSRGEDIPIIVAKDIVKMRENLGNSSSSQYANKNAVAIGDSHSVVNYTVEKWMDVIKKRKGIIPRYDIIDKLDVNSDQSKYSWLNNYMLKAAHTLKDIQEEEGIPVDLIFLENVHNAKNDNGSITDFPYNPSQNIEHVPSVTIPSYSEAYSYWDENKDTIIQSVSSDIRKGKSVISFPYNVITKTLTFSANEDIGTGYVKMVINGKEFNTEVTEGMTLSEIVAAMSTWNYSDYGIKWVTKSLNSNSYTLEFKGDDDSYLTDKFSIDTNTSIQMVVGENSTETGVYTRYYNKVNIKDWEISSNWVETSYSGAFTYPVIKGIIEYIQETFPNALLVWWTPANINLTKQSYRENGIFDYDNYKTTDNQYLKNKACNSMMEECAAYYNIPCIRVDELCGITPLNMWDFYNENDVHLKSAGYERYGETISDNL